MIIIQVLATTETKYRQREGTTQDMRDNEFRYTHTKGTQFFQHVGKNLYIPTQN
jgi:hypothetical protein